MKLHILGCLSGTEPMPEKHHTSWVLECADGSLYWFDAGDNCGHTAFLKGLDPRRTRALFISHCHRDHIDGLFHLCGVICKLFELEPETPPMTLPVYASERQLVPAIRQLIHMDNECGSGNFSLEDRPIPAPGVLYEDPRVRVECLGNCHLPPRADGSFRSWSFRITAEGKTILYSGDVKDAQELAPFLAEGCDCLLMESGHHSPPVLCGKWKQEQRRIGRIVWVHHGREMLRDEKLCLERCSAAWGSPVFAAHDGMTLSLN